MYNFDKLCVLGAKMIDAPYGVNPEALLWAIGGVESTWGRNNVPRHEKAYHRGGAYFNRALDRRFGCAAHCSYGPWQLMYENVQAISKKEITPQEMNDTLTALVVSVEWLNQRVIGRGADTVAKIADAWNSGTHRDRIIPVAYIDKVVRKYDKCMADTVRW
ncbi:hypothetical protein LCGC14_1849580 [marine sediment metagenome]|uniref:Transglycosylase SLT domain-containing protein n=1 Tax=marine sediment metagenome TaxID=412755 RepID=A0A0F9GAZ9_9ZZZZ